jgi:hypothetical protein
MQYRIVVAYQNAAWDKGSAELRKLFEKVKQEECLRRMNLREFLVAFVQRQQRLFLSLPSVHNSLLEELVGKEMTRKEMEHHVQSTIQTRAAKYKKDSVKTSPTTLEGAADDNLDLNLESPLTSDLMCKAKVIERKGAGVNAEWVTSLAIMTADSYLHFFDLESQRINSGSSPEAAFKVLMPNVVLPTSDNLLLGKANFTKSWESTLTPTVSLVLGKCMIQVMDDTSFELKETVATTGASKMFGKMATKKVQVRTLTKGETEDWIAVLTA